MVSETAGSKPRVSAETRVIRSVGAWVYWDMLGSPTFA